MWLGKANTRNFSVVGLDAASSNRWILMVQDNTRGFLVDVEGSDVPAGFVVDVEGMDVSADGIQCKCEVADTGQRYCTVIVGVAYCYFCARNFFALSQNTMQLVCNFKFLSKLGSLIITPMP